MTLMKQIFSEQGIPKVVRSDNGPQYDGQAFRDFAKEYNLKHVTSSPQFPQSNGFIESQVKTIKNILKKAQQTKTNPYLALVCLRTTPTGNRSFTPSELLHGRHKTIFQERSKETEQTKRSSKVSEALLNYRTTPADSKLQTPAKLLNQMDYRTQLQSMGRLQRPKTDDHDLLYLQRRQQTQREQHRQRHGRELDDLSSGQAVAVYNPSSKTWPSWMICDQMLLKPPMVQSYDSAIYI